MADNFARMGAVVLDNRDSKLVFSLKEVSLVILFLLPLSALLLLLIKIEGSIADEEA
jgi:hypothetical protein